MPFKRDYTLGLPRVSRLDNVHSISTTGATELTELEQTLEVGTFQFDYRLIVRSATTTVSPTFSLNFTGTGAPVWWFQYADNSATLLAAIGQMSDNVSTSTLGFQMAQAEKTEGTTTTTMGPTGGVQTTASDTMCLITGIVVVTAAGALELWHGSETATATSVEVGSSLSVIRTA